MILIKPNKNLENNVQFTYNIEKTLKIISLKIKKYVKKNF